MKNSYVLKSGDNKKVLRDLPENSVDLCVTDPPYGMKMADWDYDVPGPDTWHEVVRVLKPGAFCLSFCSPQLYHRLAQGMEDAGLPIIDQIMWVTTTKMAKANGLKPCHEPIAVTQKPRSEKTVKENIAKWGVGRVNIEDTRVPWGKEPPKGWVANGHKRRHFGAHVLDKSRNTKGSGKVDGTVDANPRGRHPGNLIGSVLPNHQMYFYDPIMDDVDAYDNYYFAGRVTTAERGEGNYHVSPKPIKLMRYLIRLYSPKNSLVLDPYSGSGSTGLAALQERCDYIGIDLSREYTDIAEKRIQDFIKSNKPISPLFFYDGDKVSGN